MGLLNTIFTVVLFIVFIGIVIWAYSSKRKDDFDEAARLPFTGDNTHPEGEGEGEQKKDNGAQR